MNINIYTFKEPTEFGGQWGATTADEPFNHVSGFDDSELGAIKEFCTALIGVVEVEMEDKEEIGKFPPATDTDVKKCLCPWENVNCNHNDAGKCSLPDPNVSFKPKLKDFGDAQATKAGDYRSR